MLALPNVLSDLTLIQQLRPLEGVWKKLEPILLWVGLHMASETPVMIDFFVAP
jgi:hypothetical protein